MKTKEVRKRLKKLNNKWRIDFVEAMKADDITGYFAYGENKKSRKKNERYENSSDNLYAKVDKDVWIYYTAPFEIIKLVCKDLKKAFSDEFKVIVPKNERTAIELRPRL